MIADRHARIAAWSLVLTVWVYMVPAAAFHSLELFPLVLVMLAYADVATASSSAIAWPR
jgi:hypothetical protein